MDTAKVNPVAIGAALSGTTITVKLGGLGPGGVTLKENKLGFEALGTGPPTSPPSLVRLFPAPQHSLEHGAPSACGAPAWVDLTPRGAWRVRASVRTARVLDHAFLFACCAPYPYCLQMGCGTPRRSRAAARTRS